MKVTLTKTDAVNRSITKRVHTAKLEIDGKYVDIVCKHGSDSITIQYDKQFSAQQVGINVIELKPKD